MDPWDSSSSLPTSLPPYWVAASTYWTSTSCARGAGVLRVLGAEVAPARGLGLQVPPWSHGFLPLDRSNQKRHFSHCLLFGFYIPGLLLCCWWWPPLKLGSMSRALAISCCSGKLLHPHSCLLSSVLLRLPMYTSFTHMGDISLAAAAAPLPKALL